MFRDRFIPSQNRGLQWQRDMQSLDVKICNKAQPKCYAWVLERGNRLALFILIRKKAKGIKREKIKSLCLFVSHLR